MTAAADRAAGAPWGARLLGVEGLRIVLASASPRRAALLRELGIAFDILAVEVSEALHPGEEPQEAARRLAVDKVRAALALLTPGDAGWVVGADTLVVAGGRALGKPRDREDARAMLRLLSGRRHEVVTGVAIARMGGGETVSGVEVTRVSFRELEEADLEALVESGEAMDKAGAYGIQGLASLAVDRIEGDYFNVVGLPLGLLRRLLQAAREAERGAQPRPRR